MTTSLDAPRRLGRVGVGALARLGDDRVHDPELDLLRGGDLHRHARPAALCSDERHRIAAQPSGLMTE